MDNTRINTLQIREHIRAFAYRYTHRGAAVAVSGGSYLWHLSAQRDSIAFQGSRAALPVPEDNLVDEGKARGGESAAEAELWNEPLCYHSLRH